MARKKKNEGEVVEVVEVKKVEKKKIPVSERQIKRPLRRL